MAGLNLYSFFKGVDDSNDEYRKQQDEERKKLEEFRAQEKLLMLQKDQEFQDATRAQYLDDYARKNAGRELGYQSSEEALSNFKSEDAQKARELARIAGVGDSTNKSQVQIGANELNADAMPKTLELQKEQFRVLQNDKAANIVAAEQSVRLKTAITEATSKSPAFNDTRLAGMYAETFARLPTLKEKQDFLTSKGYGITANEDGTYKLGNDPVAYTQDEVNEVLRSPSTAMAKILDARNARSTTMAAQVRANTALNGTAAVQQSTIAKNAADAANKNANATATTNANSPTAATTKALVPTSPFAALQLKSPLIEKNQASSSTAISTLSFEAEQLRKMKEAAEDELNKPPSSSRNSEKEISKMKEATILAKTLNDEYQKKLKELDALKARSKM